MKKGCFIVIVIVVIGSIWAFFKIHSLVKKMEAFGKEFEQVITEIRDNTKELNTQYPFEQPKLISLTENQIQSFFAVRRELNITVKNTEMAQLMKKFEQAEDSETEPDFGDFTDLFKSILPSVRTISDQYFTSLDLQHLSPDEYSYISGVTIGLIAIELDKGNFKDVVSEDFSLEIRKMMLNAEQNQKLLFLYKQNLLELPDQSYEAVYQVVAPHISDFNEIEDSFYFDMFVTDFLDMDDSYTDDYDNDY
ncbi:MAG: hypothetical protein JW860_05700 [Sedimentisphaerales bacterium]|nr:hypothetical protein [Sedimentisphaerales bacterium]